MTTRNKAVRKFTTAASIGAIMLGSLALAGCGNDDDEVPPVQEEPAMEEPAMEPTDEGAGLDQDQTVQDQPVDQQQPIDDAEPAGDQEEQERTGTGTGTGGAGAPAANGSEDPMMQEDPAPTEGTGGGI